MATVLTTVEIEAAQAAVNEVLRERFPAHTVVTNSEIQIRLGYFELAFRVSDTEYTSALKKLGGVLAKSDDYTAFVAGITNPVRAPGRPKVVEVSATDKVSKVSVKIMALLSQLLPKSAITLPAIADCLVGTPNRALDKLLIGALSEAQYHALKVAGIRPIYGVLALHEFTCVNTLVKVKVEAATAVLATLPPLDVEDDEDELIDDDDDNLDDDDDDDADVVTLDSL